MIDAHGTRRTFFMHPAHRRVGVVSSTSTLDFPNRPEVFSSREVLRPPRVCLVSGCPHFESDASLVAFEELLDRCHGATCRRAFSTQGDDLPGVENLDWADCVLLFARRMTIDGEPLDRFRRYCQRGGALVAVQAADHAFAHWPQMEREVLGCDSLGHYGNRLTEIEIIQSEAAHPILDGVRPFASRASLYENSRLAADAQVLLTGTFPGQTHPVAWVRHHRGGRVFCTTLGHPLDFLAPSFLRMLANAVRWTANG